MQSKIVILSAGCEAHLLQLRNEVLSTSGYTVVSALSALESIDRFCAGDFDLVLLCHSFSDEEQAVIAQAVHGRSPSTPVLVLTINDRNNRFADVLVGNEPAALIRAIAQATSQRFLFNLQGAELHE